MLSRFEIINGAGAYVTDILDSSGLAPKVGIILGSGLGRLAEEIAGPVEIPYRDIPGFPISTAVGHKGSFIVGSLGGKTVIAMQGRIHYYEGYSMDQVVLPVRVMCRLGIKALFVSNAAGGVNKNFHTGDMMVITDHINLMPNPLVGPNLEEFGPRFPDMTRPYDPVLRQMAFDIAGKLGYRLQEGVYVALTGPTYETPHEYKFIRLIGGDAVGMSTVPEVIAARHANVPVFGMSVITDEAHDDNPDVYVTDQDDIVKQADTIAEKMSRLFAGMIERL